jgi:hypothetical protein
MNPRTIDHPPWIGPVSFLASSCPASAAPKNNVSPNNQTVDRIGCLSKKSLSMLKIYK